MTLRIARYGYGLLGAVVVAIAITTSGCHMENPDAPTPSTDTAKALDELKSLPSLEDTQTAVQNAMNEITTTATKVNPSISWLPMHGGSTGNCEAPYDQSDGKRIFLPDLVAQGAQLSESDWATILAAAKESAAKIGATEVQVMQDQPGNHDVGFYGPTGIFIKIAYKGNLVVSGYTGCRLPQDKK